MKILALTFSLYLSVTLCGSAIAADSSGEPDQSASQADHDPIQGQVEVNQLDGKAAENSSNRLIPGGVKFDDSGLTPLHGGVMDSRSASSPLHGKAIENTSGANTSESNLKPGKPSEAAVLEITQSRPLSASPTLVPAGILTTPSAPVLNAGIPASPPVLRADIDSSRPTLQAASSASRPMLQPDTPSIGRPILRSDLGYTPPTLQAPQPISGPTLQSGFASIGRPQIRSDMPGTTRPELHSAGSSQREVLQSAGPAYRPPLSPDISIPHSYLQAGTLTGRPVLEPGPSGSLARSYTDALQPSPPPATRRGDSVPTISPTTASPGCCLDGGKSPQTRFGFAPVVPPPAPVALQPAPIERRATPATLTPSFQGNPPLVPSISARRSGTEVLAPAQSQIAAPSPQSESLLWDTWWATLNDHLKDALMMTLHQHGDPAGADSVHITVNRNHHLTAEIKTSGNREFDQAVMEAYQSLDNSPWLEFPPGSRRSVVENTTNHRVRIAAPVSAVNTQSIHGDRETYTTSN